MVELTRIELARSDRAGHRRAPLAGGAGAPRAPQEVAISIQSQLDFSKFHNEIWQSCKLVELTRIELATS